MLPFLVLGIPETVNFVEGSSLGVIPFIRTEKKLQIIVAMFSLSALYLSLISHLKHGT